MAEGDVAPVDLSDPTQPEAFPLPVGEQIIWTMGGSVVSISSDGRVTYGYPAVMFDAVERDDAGDYTLTASNTRSDGSEIGRATGSFTLNVYCEPWEHVDCAGFESIIISLHGLFVLTECVSIVYKLLASSLLC